MVIKYSDIINEVKIIKSLSDKIDPKHLKDIIDGDKTPTKKYVNWILKQVIDTKIDLDVFTSMKSFLIDLVNDFEEIKSSITINKLKNYGGPSFNSKVFEKPTDINSYEDYVELNNMVSFFKELKSKSDTNVNKIFEDDEFLVIEPKSFLSSCKYGGGTKWCTTTRNDDSNFIKYTKDGYLFYIIDKGRKIDHPLYKIALHTSKIRYKNGINKKMFNSDTVDIFNAPDTLLKNVNPIDILPDKVIISIIDYIDKDNKIEGETNEYNIDNLSTIIFDLIKNNKVTSGYHEFDIVLDDMSGTILWVNSKKEFYATPFWEGQNGIPISDDEDTIHFISSNSEFKNEKEVINWYINFYLPEVYKVLKYYL